MTLLQMLNRFLIFIWAFLVIFIGYGLFLPESEEGRTTVHMQHSASEVWQALIAVENYPQWWKEIKAVKAIESLPSGQVTFSLQDQRGEWNKFEVLEQKPGEAFAYRSQNQDFHWILSRKFTLKGLSPTESQLEIIELRKNRTALYRTYYRVFSNQEKGLERWAFQLKAHMNSQKPSVSLSAEPLKKAH